MTPGPLETLPLEALRREFDVNGFSAVSAINAFLPAIRHTRGRIVQISTWTASLPLPFNGLSGASKAAMDVLATIYRAELKPFGIDVVIAAPGNIRTGGPAQTAAALARVAERLTADERQLRALRNKNNILAWYDLMIDQKRSEEAASKYVTLACIQHNPLIPAGTIVSMNGGGGEQNGSYSDPRR